MVKRVGRAACVAVLTAGAFGFTGIAAIASAPAGASPRAAAVAPRESVVWVGTVVSLNLKHGSFVYDWDGAPYTVKFTSKTKFSHGSVKTLKKGLSITVTGNLSGSTITATKIVV